MAGCGLAVALLRAYLRLPQDVPAVAPAVPRPWKMRRYIDDMVLWAVGAAHEAVRNAREAFLAVRQHLEGRGMQLNLSKTAVLTTSAATGHVARPAFAELGVDHRDTVRDLGVDVCWGRRRQTTRSARNKAMQQRADRLARLPSGPHFRGQAAAALLVAGGIYGTAIDGLAPSVGRGMRRAVRKALVPGHGARRMLEADLAFAGQSGRLDPLEAATLAAVTTWARLLPQTHICMDRIEELWCRRWG